MNSPKSRDLVTKRFHLQWLQDPDFVSKRSKWFEATKKFFCHRFIFDFPVQDEQQYIGIIYKLEDFVAVMDGSALI